MATPPFNIDETKPGDTDIISQHPAAARTMRDVVESWLLVEHNTGGHHQIKRGTVAARDAITDWTVGSMWINTDATPNTLQFLDSTGPNVWITIGPVQASGITATELATDAVTTAKILNDNVTLAKLAHGTQGGLLYFAASGAPTELAAGTSGLVLKTKGAGANPVWEAHAQAGTALTLDPWTINTNTVQAHGLGAEPDFVRLIIECKTAEFGWSVGDRCLLPTTVSTGSATAAYSVEVDATNVRLLIGSVASSRPQIIRKDTLGQSTITAANWKAEITPYRLVI